MVLYVLVLPVSCTPSRPVNASFVFTSIVTSDSRFELPDVVNSNDPLEPGRIGAPSPPTNPTSGFPESIDTPVAVIASSATSIDIIPTRRNFIIAGAIQWTYTIRDSGLRHRGAEGPSFRKASMIRRSSPESAALCGIILVASALALGHTDVQASPQPGPAIFLHARPANATKNPCADLNITNCYQVETRGDMAQPDVGPYYFVYLLANGNPQFTGLSGLQFGLFYQDNQAGGMLDGAGVDIFSWHPCVPLEFPSQGWPQPGSGNLMIWPAPDCQTAPLVVAGYFYTGAYSPDILAVTPRPVDSRASVTNCASQELVLSTSHLGRVAFSAGATDYGCNGCLGGCPPLPWPPVSPGPTALSLHLARPPLPPSTCSALGPISCDTLATSGTSSGAGEHYYAYVLASIGGLRGLSQIRFGIDYDGGTPGGATNLQGLDILSWTRCGPGSMVYDSNWLNPGASMTLTWDYSMTGCPDLGSTVVAGYFYVSAYSADVLRLTPPAGSSTARLRDCVFTVTDLDVARLGHAAFSPDGSLAGCRPCTEPCAATAGAGGNTPAPGNARLEILSAQPARIGAPVHLLAASPGESADLGIFDVSGRRVRRLPAISAGSEDGLTRWDLRDDSGHTVTPGVYFVRLSARTRLVKRLVVVP